MNNTTTQINLRMPTDRVHLVKEAAKARGEDFSDFVRRSVYRELARLSYLSPADKKALGMS